MKRCSSTLLYTLICIIGIISACHNCSYFPNGSLSVFLLELLRGAVKAVAGKKERIAVVFQCPKQGRLPAGQPSLHKH